ncbi:MAG: DUF4384 domain-containing protein [Lautropia sp.]
MPTAALAFASALLAAGCAVTEPSAPAGVTAGEPPFVHVASSRGPQAVHRRGQPFEIDVVVDQDTHLYCFLVDEHRRVNQFFPNRAQPDPQVRGGTRMQFPGRLPFRFVASESGVTESVACYAAPAGLGAEPMKELPQVGSTAELTAAFRKLAGPRTGVGVYDVQSR